MGSEECTQKNIRTKSLQEREHQGESTAKRLATHVDRPSLSGIPSTVHDPPAEAGVISEQCKE